MHKLNLSVIAGLALALASTGALAQKKQTTPAPAPAPSTSGSSIGQGDMELGFFGNLRDDGTTTSLILGAAVGSYLSDNLELRVTPTIAFIDGGGVSATLFSPYVSAEYQIPTRGAVVPYVGGGIGFYMLTLDTGAAGDFFYYSLFVTPTGGVKYFLNERTSLEYALSYQFPLFGEICGDTDCFDADITTLSNTFRINIYY